MECNKEEAIRAKGIAEKKMQNKDFSGARKIAYKAQQLYPDLDNISQIISVCEVHCSAETKVYGNEKDWYGILKIEPTADETTIKRQYRKYALLLHPDKNKFAGADDAFKLIGEAQRVLLDRDKRMFHDNKSKASRHVAPNQAPQQGSSNTNVGKQPLWQSHSMSNANSPNAQHQQPQRQTQQGSRSDRPTFWTVCPSCSVRYQYYREVLGKLIVCQSCKNTFPCHEIKVQVAPPGTKTNGSRPPLPQQKAIPRQGPFKANVQGSHGNSVPEVGSQAKISSENQTRESVLKSGTSESGVESKGTEKNGKVNGKKRKQVAESSSSGPEEGNGNVLDKQNLGRYSEVSRRSTRSKHDVSYDEKLIDDDDLISLLKRVKCSEPFSATEDPLLKEEVPKMNKPESRSGPVEEDVNNIKLETSPFSNGKSNLSPAAVTDPEIYEYPDPDFNDFDKVRSDGCFVVGQTWAIYDTLDAMPRFYARITKVLSPGFKLQITWLEAEPDNEDEIEWAEEGRPISCGKFKHGKSQKTEDRPMFSHLVLWEKGSRRGTYMIYPRKGETWALFKNWDINWRSDPEGKRKYEYEFVEILSDYAEGSGISVAYLRKVNGFSCLFCRTGKKGVDSFQVPIRQLFRFSHRVPSFQMSGDEREDVPKGSFELDPASLPTNLEEITVPEVLKSDIVNKHTDMPCRKSLADKVEPVITFEERTSGYQKNKKTKLDQVRINSNICAENPDASLPSTVNSYDIPDPEFYNFDVEKLPEKFQIGQIWALYSDEDGLPKYYARITKIVSQPRYFRLHITWLASCPLPNNTIRWRDNKMLICCGMFRLQKRRSEEYSETGPFSHRVGAEHTDKPDVYCIFPKKGEVWALYKHWTAEIKYSDLKTCEYDFVEIVEENNLGIKVLALELVNGFKSVFRSQTKGGLAVTKEIARVELLRFSHQIPAFQLTGERGGSLRGCWELDPAALPIGFFR